VIEWQHKEGVWSNEGKRHPVDPHHTATGDWVCYQCRAPIFDGTKIVRMTVVKGMARPTPDDPDMPGLATEGS